MRSLLIVTWIVLVFGGHSVPALAQAITGIEPRSCQPGTTTQITLHGTGLDGELRAVADAAIKLIVVENSERHVVLAASLPETFPLGPYQLWLATPSGSLLRQSILVDDLPPVQDQGGNHSLDTAQWIRQPCAIQGLCDGPRSDVYRLHCSAGERIAVEVHTQQLRSTMDPVLRLRDSSGRVLMTVDDEESGPDCGFSYQFSQTGDYYLEVHDSRFANAGAAYHLRIGDFPRLNQCFPLAVQYDQDTEVRFVGEDAHRVAAKSVHIPASSGMGLGYLTASFRSGEGSDWVPLLASEHPQVIESSIGPGTLLTSPIGINGSFEKPREIDGYSILGQKGQTVRFAARTKSLGSPSVMQMRLLREDELLAETKIADTDEWSFDHTFAADGVYRLEANELLSRSGSEYNYLIEITPAGSFSLAFQSDKPPGDELIIDPKQGDCAIELLVTRFGYEGEIELSLESAHGAAGVTGLRILNPRIPPGAESARVILAAQPDWKANSLVCVRIAARAVGEPSTVVWVNGQDLRRAMEPHVIRPHGADRAVIVVAGNAESEVSQDFQVYPSQIVLDEPLGQQRIVVIGKDSQGMDRDGTRSARMVMTDASIAELRDGVVFPLADGSTEIEIELDGQTRIVPVVVANQAERRPIRFESEVLVALSKQGCNSGACHGSPPGKGGFRLSLRAFDVFLDRTTLIREDFGRRVNPLEPDESLLLKKPLMQVAHGGGKQLNPHDAAYTILRDWIAGGAEADPVGSPRVSHLEVFPDRKQVLTLASGTQQLAATAHFSDGSFHDVTHLVAYESSDNKVASVDADGLVTPHVRGEVVILVRYLEHIESVPLMFVQEQPGFRWSSPSPRSEIDALVYSKLEQLQYLPAEICSDSEFIRRVSLDVLGILPTIAETKAFLADDSENKRERFVDSLLEREEYAKFWALKWGDLLRMTRKRVGDDGVHKYHRWLEDSFRDNSPYDRFARELITGSGSTLANPPANFYRTAGDMADCVETISQVFLGARLQCAKCHNHPFERWTQDNYYGLGAFFNRVRRRQTERPGEMFIYSSHTDEVRNPRTDELMQPWLPQVGNVEAMPETDRRFVFADWLVDRQNPYFARIEANRIWSQFFARGIVDPIDDFRDSNPPSNAPLLDALAENFANSGFDRKHLIRAILNSYTYQASSQTTEFNSEDRAYFSRQEPRLLKAEQLLDAINQTLGLSEDFVGLPEGTLATQLPAPDVVVTDFLKSFGQPERSTVCACERSPEANLAMAIEMFNGTKLHEKLGDENNRFHKSLAAGRGIAEVIDDLFIAAVSRPPTETELSAAIAHCKKSHDLAAGIEDVCWALFNTDEFLFQH